MHYIVVLELTNNEFHTINFLVVKKNVLAYYLVHCWENQIKKVKICSSSTWRICHLKHWSIHFCLVKTFLWFCLDDDNLDFGMSEWCNFFLFQVFCPLKKCQMPFESEFEMREHEENSHIKNICTFEGKNLWIRGLVKKLCLLTLKTFINPFKCFLHLKLNYFKKQQKLVLTFPYLG